MSQILNLPKGAELMRLMRKTASQRRKDHGNKETLTDNEMESRISGSGGQNSGDPKVSGHKLYEMGPGGWREKRQAKCRFVSKPCSVIYC